MIRILYVPFMIVKVGAHAPPDSAGIGALSTSRRSVGAHLNFKGLHISSIEPMDLRRPLYSKRVHAFDNSEPTVPFIA